MPAFFALVLACSTAAANPLGLTPGTAANATLGALASPGNFNTSIHSGNIGYSSAALASRLYNVRLPSGYDPNNPAKKYGLIVFIDSGNTPAFPAAYAAALDAYDVIWIAPHSAGNDVLTTERSGAAIMGAFRMSELYNINPARIYASGLSGGSRVASEMSYLRSDYFRGLIGRVGAGLPEIIPDFSVGGNLTDASTSNDNDSDYEYFFAWAGQPSVVMPFHFRTALISQYSDFRRAELLGIYRYGHLNHGNTARIIMRPGGHSDTVGPSFNEALDLMYHPLVDVVWDRFENSFLASNLQAGKTVAGTGFSTLSGNVSEGTYSYNSANHGVLKLVGDAAAAASNDTFAWRNNFGVLVDARLRAENATTPGQNQQIGLHIVPANATGPIAAQPGFHLYWGYGQPHRAEIVSADGVRKTLATWEHSGTHPMNLPANDKTFWDSSIAPDYAGRTRAFRGEDVRLSLNSAGFQITFNRPVINLATGYPDKVVTATSMSPIDDPAANPSESLPLLLQGFWNEVETTLVNGLPAGEWRIVLSNDAITADQPVGTALVDEIRVIGSTGLLAAPASLAVAAPANTTRSLTWGQIHGAMGYVIERSTSPDGPFAQIASLGNHLSTYSDTVASNTAYYYRVAAVGSDGNTGHWSPISFAKRSPSLPATPTNPAVTYPAAYQVRLAWTDAANNETGYRVERSPAGYGQWSLVSGLLSAGATAFLDTNALAGAAYDYRISAINADGLSSYATISATVPDAAPPAPTGLNATATYASVDLTWTPVSQAASYRVKRSDVSGGPYNTIGSGITAASFSDTSFTPGATHYYIVSAVSGSGLLEANSAEISVAALQLLPPTQLTVTPGFTMNTLSWTAATGATSYNILRAASAEGPFVTIASGLTDTSFTDTALVSGTTYFYAVRSVNGTVISAASGTTSGTPVPGTATKANNTTALDSGSSWLNGQPPTALDTARWDSSSASGAVSIGSGLAVDKLQIVNPAASVTITAGSGALSVGSGGIDMSTATQSLTIQSPAVLTASQTWTAATSRNLFLTAPVTESGGSRALSVNGAGGVILQADNTYTGLTTISAGTLHLGGTAGATNGSVAGPINLAGGILRVNRTDACAPIGGAFSASSGNFQVNMATGVITLNAVNLPANSTNTFTSLTGTAGATFVVNAHPSASLAFGGTTAGINAVIKSGNVTFTTSSSGFNFRVEGGSLTASPAMDRFQLAATNGTQSFQVTGGSVDLSKVTTYGFRVGGSGSANQAGAQNVTGIQSNGSVLVSFCTIGGTDTSSSKNPSYTLVGGTFTATNTGATALQLGADTAGLGTSTFTLTGTGKLAIPGTISGAQSGARQIFAMTGGTLAAATINLNNLRSTADASNGTFTQSSGTLAPGDTGVAGRTAITGQYILGASASVALDLGGTTQATGFQAGGYDFVSVTASANLAGQLRISLLPGFKPANTDVFTVLNASSGLSGAFANAASGTRIPTSGGEGSFLVTQTGTTIQLSAYLTGLQSWRQTHFGTTANTGTAANLEDPDTDGTPNLLEYALGASPTSANSRPAVGTDIIGSESRPGRFLAITFDRIADPALTYIVEGANDLSNTWLPIWQSTGAANSVGPVTVEDSFDITSGTLKRFLRLKISAP